MGLFTKMLNRALDKTQRTVAHLQENLERDLASTEQQRTEAYRIECEPYAYSSLGSTSSIRVLRLNPQGTSHLEGSLLEVDLDKDPLDYNALSYTWGDPRPPLLQTISPSQAGRKFPLITDGKVLYITQNLFHALETLRNIDRNRPRPGGVIIQPYIWIDAICINQEDLAERSSQVAMMDKIYKSAHSVISWLGKEDRYTASALRLMEKLASIPKQSYPHYAAMGLSHSNASETEWEALVAFLCRPYFNRAWIVQEIMLSQRILALCGTTELPWTTLTRCSAFISATGTQALLSTHRSRFMSLEDQAVLRVAPAFGRALSCIDALAKDVVEGLIPLYIVLWLCRGFEATDPKDRAYASLGLVKELIRLAPERAKESGISLSDLLIPDYSKTVATIYTENAMLMIKAAKNLLVLSQIGDLSLRNPSFGTTLPSWVPDLSVPLYPPPLTLIVNSPLWDAVGNGRKGEGIVVDNRVLCVNGGYFDTIVGVLPPFDEMEEQNDWLPLIEFMLSGLDRAYPDSRWGFAEAFWRTMIADSSVSQNQRIYPVESSMAQAFNEWLISRVYLIRHGGSKPIAMNQISTQLKIFTELMDQVGRDPGAFQAETEASYRKGIQDRQRAAELVRERMRTASASTQDAETRYRFTLAKLELLSRYDSSGLFWPMERIHHSLALSEGPDSEAKRQLVLRKNTFRGAMAQISSARRLYITTRGYLGLGTKSTQVGDQVWLLHGHNVPFVLRPVQQSFEILGESYVHGIMCGEAVVEGKMDFHGIELV